MPLEDTKLNIEKAINILKSNGKLELSLKGFEPRVQQQEMMHNILEAYNEDKIALIEAGTGTGKSFAYLIPAILWAAQNKERTVISTHTIALQEQLLHKDIPIIAKALNIELKAVLIKGMGNYLCRRKLQETSDEHLFLNENEHQELQKFESWNQTTKDGSRSSLPFAPSSDMWEKVSAENDTCTNSKCDYFQECHFFKARRRANDAQILIVNHHLLFADLNRRAEAENYTDPAILPAYTRVIIDEAHHIEDIATEYFAKNINRLNLLRIIGRLAAEKQAASIGRLPFLKQKIVDYYKSKTYPAEITSILSRLNIDLAGNKNDLLTYIVKTFDAFSEFVTKVLPSDHNPERENKLRLHAYHQTHPVWQSEIIPNAKELMNAIHKYTRSIESIDQDIKSLDDEKLNEVTKTSRFETLALSNRLRETAITLSDFVSATATPNKVRWIELQQNINANIHLNDADLDIAKACVDYLFSKFSTVILCSATLTTNQKFHFFRERLGLTEKLLPKQEITENVYDSPFNFEKQAMLVVPTDIPNPQDPQFTKSASEKIWQIIQASHGNAFILFTSYSMLNICHKYLEKKLTDAKYSVFKQGDESRQKLLEKFKNKDRSVLFGTDSFWEGVDVSGEALRCVVMVKLPFKVPSDPIIQARSQAIEEKGGDSFLEYSLPSAIVKFKQGFGRLIRNKTDRGCIVCLDSRILQKGYGKQFLSSLPNCQRFFGPSDQMEKQMVDFYKRTYHLVIKK
jgi:ATP-dependent DNA helicase DinG